MNISGVLLYKILDSPDTALDAFASLKPAHLDSSYLKIYAALSSYYQKYNKLPTFEELKLYKQRDKHLTAAIIALQSLDVPDELNFDLLLDALVNEYTQNEVLKQLDQFIDSLTTLSSEEVKEELAGILLHLEEKTHNSSTLYTMSDILVLEDPEEVAARPVSYGIRDLDEQLFAKTTELIMLGGYRGSGKSVFSTNIWVRQFELGFSSAYFSIEMDKSEVFQRGLSILSGVPYESIRKNNLTPEQELTIKKARAKFFEDSPDIDLPLQEFETQLVKHKLKRNQLVIIDDQNLSLQAIDMHLTKLKAQFNDSLKVVVVDYVNQIQIDDIFNWKSQIALSKGLKALARKHEVHIFSPYQVHDSGEAKFSKSLLDAADVSMVIKRDEENDKELELKTTKTRNIKPFDLILDIDWDTLRIGCKPGLAESFTRELV